MSNFGKKSLALHKKYGGKLEIKSKVSIKNLADLSTCYTPGVAAMSLAMARNASLARTHSIKGNMVAIVTDGSAVLGLGNIGPLAALPVMEGKAILLKEFAGVDAFPICLDTQDPQKIIETVKIIAPVFGAIQLEDIAAPNCFIIERTLKQLLDIPVLHDDQHGTAVVVLAALINALKVKKNAPDQIKVVVCGAGAAGIGVTKLLIEYGFKNLIVTDSHGTIFKGRENLSDEKRDLANVTNPKKIAGDLMQALIGADVFIGVSKAGILKPEMIKKMNKQPIIFALSNPIPEIMPSLAKRAGAFIVATGRSDFPNQINNVLAFPGIFRGALDNKVRDITSKMLIQAAKNLAAETKNISPNKILPDIFNKSVAKKVAAAIKN